MIKGIDVYHNDPITPQTLTSMVKGHRIFFNFIKSSTGINGKDSAFADYWNMSRKAGLLCGAYHWLWPAADATLQANNFINQYKTVSRTGVLPPVVDIEWTWNAKDSGNQNDKNELWHNLSPTLRVSFIKTYLDKVESELNVKPIIYTAASFWKELIESNSTIEDDHYFSQYLLWIADPNGNKKLPRPWNDLKATFIQSHFGENSNSNDLFDKTDQNVFNGDLKELLNITVPGFTVMRGFPFSMIVLEFQKILSNGNFLTDEPDGYFGKNTEAAVIAFQIANGLIGNGIIDAQTWGKLLA